jgi:glycosyltransferase involved in cell wall biosynthesis
MAGLEAMATGRPLIANGRPEIVDSFLGEKLPICQATTPQEVSEQLQRLLRDQAERARLGRESRAFVETRLSSEQAARTCLERLGFEKNPTLSE